MVITTYNRPVETVKRAIDSVISQTYTKLELIIVNDCPSNQELAQKVGELIRSYQDNRISYYINKRNLGACASRNIGIKRSRGEYVAFLDDDDEWLPNKLFQQIKLFRNDRIGLVYCKYFRVDEKSKMRRSVPIKDIRKNSVKGLLKQNAVGSTSFPLIRKECFQQCGMFNTHLRSCQDWDMWIRIAKKYQVDFSNDFLVNYYVSEDGITADMKKRLQGWKLMLRIYSEDYKQNKGAYIFFLRFIADQLYENKYYLKGAWYSFRAKTVELIS